MLKSLSTLLLMALSFAAWPQTSELEELYNKAKFEKCIKACDKALSSNSKNMDALLYQALCFTQLSLGEKTEKDFKDGAEKACRMIEKMRKLDKDSKFSIANQNRLLELELLQCKRAESYKATKKAEKAGKLLELMIAMENSNHARYSKWNLQEPQEKADGENMDLLNEAAKDIYLNIKSNPTAKPYLPEAFSELALLLSRHSKLSNSLTIIARGEEIFGKSALWRKTRIQAISIKAEKGGKTISKEDAKEVIDACESATEADEAEPLKKIRNATIENRLMSTAETNDKPEFTKLLIAEIDRSKKGTGLEEREIYDLLLRLTLDRTNTNEPTAKEMTSESSFYMTLLTDFLKATGKNAASSLEQNLNELIQTQQPLAAFKLLVNLKTAYPKNKSLANYDNKILEQTLTEAQKNGNKSQKWDKLQKLAALYPKNASLQSAQRNFLTESINEYIDKRLYSEAGRYLQEALLLAPNDPAFLAMKLRWVKEDYKANFVTTSISDDELGWTGSTEACQAGSIAEAANKKVVQRLNYVRRLAGLPDQSELRAEYNNLCQQAALIMHANNSLSHYPPKTWKCYSEGGARGAGNSNLSWGTSGYHSTNALMGQLSDDGSNYQVGHRRWILYPYRKVFGHGSTPGTMALWALGGSDCNYPDSVTERYRLQPVCWPPADYVPARLVARRWSFSLGSADFSTAEVSMKQNGKAIKLKLEAVSNGYGSNTLVWVPEINNSLKQSTFEVTIKKVKLNKGEQKSYTYKVIPIDPSN